MDQVKLIQIMEIDRLHNALNATHTVAAHNIASNIFVPCFEIGD